jgi:hypothetical protein
MYVGAYVWSVAVAQRKNADAHRGEILPPGVKLAPRGELCPLRRGEVIPQG